MSSAPSRCSDTVKEILLGHGACRVAIASVSPVDPQAQELYARWLKAGNHGSMQYLENYPDIRRNPQLLLPGARSIICCAFAYHPAPVNAPLRIASYALGTDYHLAIRERLERAANALRELLGGDTRVCVDTAPLRERYWAVRSGLGVMGMNNHVIIPGIGSYILLGEILTTAELTPDTPMDGDCGQCGRCVKACPTGALQPDGSVDARKCLSYLTIEHRGAFEPGTDLHGCLYGCDRCAAACPHNRHADTTGTIPELQPRPELLRLTLEECLTMSQQQFSTLFRHSSIKRTKLAGLRRNAEQIAKKSHGSEGPHDL